MDVQELLTYLSQAITLETELYSLGKVMKFNEDQRMEMRREPEELRYPNMPEEKPEPRKPTRRVVPRPEVELKKVLWDVWERTISLGFFVLCLQGGIIVFLAYDEMNFWLSVFVSFLFSWLPYFAIAFYVYYSRYNKWADNGQASEQARANEKYESDMIMYKLNLEKQQRQRESAVGSYERRLAYMENEYKTELEGVRRHNRIAKHTNRILDQVELQLAGMMTILESSLNELYNIGVIYGKYRHVIALASFFDYFASGRCDELEGYEGAYNLFEMELRLDKIIYQIELVNANLQQIQKNQYKLYCAIADVNHNISVLSDGIRQGLNQVAQAQGELYSGVVQAGAMTKGLSDQVDGYVSRLEGVNREVLDYLAKCKKS